MNFLPEIKLPRNKNSFVSPIKGKQYSNLNFLQQCDYPQDPQSSQLIKSRKKTNSEVVSPDGGKRKLSLKRSQKITRHCQYFRQSQNSSSQKVKSLKTVITPSLATPKYLTEVTYLAGRDSEHKFQDIEVRMLSKISSYSDIPHSFISINLSFYFSNFFRKSLGQPYSQTFIDQVEQKMKHLIESYRAKNKQVDESVNTDLFPEELFTIHSIEQFLAKLAKLQSKNSTKQLQAMVKYYCFPKIQYRESMFRDVMHLLTQKAQKQFSQPEQEYLLMNDHGIEIKDIIQIPFSTSILLLAPREQAKDKYKVYEQLLVDHRKDIEKRKFVQGLKNNFRNNVSKGFFQELDKHESHMHHEGRMSKLRVKKAEGLISLHRSSQKNKEFMSNASCSPSNFDSLEEGRHSTLTSKSKNIKLKLSMLYSQRKKGLSVGVEKKCDNKYLAEFLQLQKINQDQPKSQESDEKLKLDDLLLPFSKLKQNHPIFKDKSEKQINKMLNSLGISVHSRGNHITYPEFQKLMDVANCQGSSGQIMKFVNHYLKFDQMGEMDREGLLQSLSGILKGHEDSEVLDQLLWCWLQKKKLIEREFVMRDKLEGNFERHVLFYRVLVSLIFNLKHISAIDMAYQILI